MTHTLSTKKDALKALFRQGVQHEIDLNLSKDDANTLYKQLFANPETAEIMARSDFKGFVLTVNHYDYICEAEQDFNGNVRVIKDFTDTDLPALADTRLAVTTVDIHEPIPDNHVGSWQDAIKASQHIGTGIIITL